MPYFDKAREIIVQLTNIAITLIALAVVLQILFGTALPFLGANIATNLVAFIQGFGDKGLVGLIAIGAIAYILTRK